MRFAIQIRFFVAAAVVVLVALVQVPAARAGCVDDHVISMFPKNVSEFACANLESVRLNSWFADFKGQVLPRELYGFDSFLVSAGVNPNTQVNQVIWAIGGPARNARAHDEAVPDSDQFAAVIVGQFDPDSIKSALESRKLPVISYRGHTLYPLAATGAPSMYFMTIDSDTSAVGEPAMLRQMLDVAQGSAESLLSNAHEVELIGGVNNEATLWGVFNGPGTLQAIRQLAPGAAQFSESAKLFQDIRSLTLSAKASSSDVEVKFEIATDTPQDSVMLSQILQAGLVVKKYLAKQATPPSLALAAILERVSVTPNSSLVEISIDVLESQLRDLILERAFSSGT
jgi:hypothetical protein